MHPELGGGHALMHHVHHSACPGTVVLDVVKKHCHCYSCDDYVTDDVIAHPEIDELRLKLETVQPPEEVDADSLLDLPASRAGSARYVSGAGRTGLTNLRNTCFMNSGIQLLASLGGFRSFFRDFLKFEGDFRQGRVHLERRATSGPFGHKELVEARERQSAHREDGSGLDQQLVRAMHSVLRVLHSGKFASFAPRSLVYAAWRHYAFEEGQQGDASEFLTWCLDTFEDELEGRSVTPSAPSVAGGMVVRDSFAVEVEYATRCHTCDAVSLRRAYPERSLELSFPQRGDVCDECTLQGCLRNYFQPTVMTGSEQYQCDTCARQKGCPVKEATSDATRTCALTHHPPNLIIQMKRTQYDRRTLRPFKDYRSVPFPLVIAAWWLPLVDQADGAKHERVYRLSSVIVHNGRTSGGGHYYAYTREVEAAAGGEQEIKWLEKNDNRVVEASEDDVLNQDEAWTVLAYELVSGPEAAALAAKAREAEASAAARRAEAKARAQAKALQIEARNRAYREVMAAGGLATLPSDDFPGWRSAIDPTSKRTYYIGADRKSSWDHPALLRAQEAAAKRDAARAAGGSVDAGAAGGEEDARQAAAQAGVEPAATGEGEGAQPPVESVTDGTADAADAADVHVQLGSPQSSPQSHPVTRMAGGAARATVVAGKATVHATVMAGAAVSELGRKVTDLGKKAVQIVTPRDCLNVDDLAAVVHIPDAVPEQMREGGATDGAAEGVSEGASAGSSRVMTRAATKKARPPD